MNYLIKLKDDVEWERLDEFGDFSEKCVISGVENVPDDLRWYSYWRKVPVRGMLDFIDVNIGTREIRCQGCLDILYDMIAAGVVEKVERDVQFYLKKESPQQN